MKDYDIIPYVKRDGTRCWAVKADGGKRVHRICSTMRMAEKIICKIKNKDRVRIFDIKGHLKEVLYW